MSECLISIISIVKVNRILKFYIMHRKQRWLTVNRCYYEEWYAKCNILQDRMLYNTNKV